MAHFKRVTSVPPSPSQTNAVIMGRKTWESIPPKFRPLDNRLNVILSRSSYTCDNEDVLVCSSLEEAMEKLNKMENTGNVYVIGGGQVYKESLESGLVKKVIYTEVSHLPSVDFDTFFPELTEDEWECKPYPGYECQEEKKTVGDARSDTIVKTDKKTGVTYQFLEFTRKSHKKQKIEKNEEMIEQGAHVNPEEMQYLEMCRDIIENGVQRGDRTGTGTLSRFGTQMRFSLRDGTLPLLTTKRTFWRGVAEELLWFVSVSHVLILSGLVSCNC